MDLDSWAGSIDLTTPAGQLLKQLAAALPSDRAFEITVFGSAPLQIMVDSRLSSADVDLFSNVEELRELVDRASLGQDSVAFYIQVSSELNFRTSPRWKDRVRTTELGNCLLRFPHPIDILIAKLNRLDEKDLEAFRVVLRKTGHPTEAELIHELQMGVDLFRPSFDEEQGHDMANNCRRLWPIIYGREIDPRAEIIAPALQKRREGYAEPTRDYKQELREAILDYKGAQPNSKR
ncbi:MAG TPA: DUF6036 family nucleotidyltransferase [Verrucomicrobiae bacterium]|jgi:hypothetical protein|nr:DUF6036 family nucleotidyltransferase [Verrucomicrobiae bacterium]